MISPISANSVLNNDQAFQDVTKKEKELKELLNELILANMSHDKADISKIQQQISNLMHSH
jgi:hypothetical protein